MTVGGATARNQPRTLDGPSGARLKAAFRYVNRFMIGMWRLGLGRWVNIWPGGSGRIMVLGHTGRRSGLRRWTPLNYAEVDGQIYCTAGFGPRSDWYLNVTADPMVEAWLPGRRLAGEVHEESGHPERTRLLREVLLASGFAAPAAGIDPRHMDDRALAAATASYQLLRIEPIPGGDPLPAHPRPGDRAWWWAIAAAIAAILLVVFG